MYYEGDGVPRDLVQAYAWVNIAAVHGDRDVKDLREQVSAKITLEQITEGQKLSTEYWEKHVVPFQGPTGQ